MPVTIGTFIRRQCQDCCVTSNPQCIWYFSWYWKNPLRFYISSIQVRPIQVAISLRGLKRGQSGLTLWFKFETYSLSRMKNQPQSCVLSPKLGLFIGVSESAWSEPNFFPRSRAISRWSLKICNTIKSLIIFLFVVCRIRDVLCALSLFLRVPRV